MNTTWVAFGSNQSDPLTQLMEARIEINASEAMFEEAASAIYLTPPWGYTEQSDFYNAVIRYYTKFSPEELLLFLQDIEKKHHRVRTFKNAPRTLDLDILLYDNLTQQNEELTLPHPRMHERAFVLQPLAEINPKINICKYGNILELLNKLDTSNQIRLEAKEVSDKSRSWQSTGS